MMVRSLSFLSIRRHPGRRRGECHWFTLNVIFNYGVDCYSSRVCQPHEYFVDLATPGCFCVGHLPLSHGINTVLGLKTPVELRARGEIACIIAPRPRLAQRQRRAVRLRRSLPPAHSTSYILPNARKILSGGFPITLSFHWFSSSRLNIDM